MEKNKKVLWAPDIIKESNGIACGDVLLINAYRNEKKLYFSYYGNACDVAISVANYLQDTFSGQEEGEILDNVERLKLGRYKEEEYWINVLSIKRKGCVESPIELLYETLKGNTSCEINSREKSILACDACVSTKPVNWRPAEIVNTKIRLREIACELETMDNPAEIEIQKLGLCNLSNKDQENFLIKLEHVSDKDFKLIKKLRLAVLLFNNAKKYNLALDKKIEELAIKQIVSLNVANEEIKIVNEYISNANLRVDSVKGGKTNRFYPEGVYRTHMDFDYLATDFEDAFKLISYLINERHFKLVVGGSVPFSLKVLTNMDKEEVLTGHIHLEKILQNRYQVVIDINMGGFPLGRTGIIQCNRKESIELEYLICITVAHLFKHEHAFMKDINDLYYLLSSNELNKELLVQKLKKYKLSNLFFIVYRFLKREMLLEAEINFEYEEIFSKKRIDLWPVSRKAHLYIKAKDMLEFNKKQFGIELGLQETKNQILNNAGEINTQEYTELVSTMNERVYLYPIIIFNEYVNAMDISNLKSVGSGIYRKKQILVLPIGLFLIQDGLCNDFDRNMLDSQIENLMNDLSLDISICNFEYVMEARKDIWLY